MQTILLGLLLAGSPPVPAPGGALDAPEAVVDRGPIETGPMLLHRFRVTNKSPSSLRLLSVSTPCGCIAPSMSAESLAPGSAADVTLLVNTLTPAAGRQTWRGVVRYAVLGRAGESPTMAELPWALSADLVAAVSLTPPALALTTSGTTPVSMKIVMTDRRAKRLTLRGATSTTPSLTIKVGDPAETPNARTTAVTVTLDPAQLGAGESAQTAVLHTDDPTCPELRLPVTINNRTSAMAVARPATAEIQLAPDQPSGTMLVQLRSPIGTPLKIVATTSDQASVTATAAAQGPSATVRIVVTPPAGESLGTATLRVTFADPKGEVVVPVRWSRR